MVNQPLLLATLNVTGRQLWEQSPLAHELLETMEVGKYLAFEGEPKKVEALEEELKKAGIKFGSHTPQAKQNRAIEILELEDQKKLFTELFKV